MAKSKSKKNIKVRDLNPKKDAKGGRFAIQSGTAVSGGGSAVSGGGTAVSGGGTSVQGGQSTN